MCSGRTHVIHSGDEMRISNIHSLPRAFVIYMLLAFTVVACGADKSDAELIASAKEYVANKELRAATIELKNVLQQNPDNAEARFLLGDIYYQTGDLASAEKEYGRALEVGWDPEQAYTGKLVAILSQAKFDEVLKESYDTSAFSNTAKSELTAIRALAYAGKGDRVQAMNTILLTDKLDPDAYNALKATYILHLADKNYEEAEKTIARALELYPDIAELQYFSANLDAINGKNDQAIEKYDRIIAAAPVDTVSNIVKKAYLEKLKISVQGQKYDQVSELRQVFKQKNIDDPQANYLFAIAAFRQKDYDLAESDLQKILNIYASHGPTLLLSGSVSYEKGDFEQASYYLGKYLANNPKNLAARKLHGRVQMALGQYQDARESFNAVLMETGNDAELIALLGLSEVGGGDPESGIRELEKALSIRPDNDDLKLRLSRIYIINGRSSDAVKLLEEVLANKGDQDFTIRSTKVLAHLGVGDFDQATSVTRQMLDESGENARLLNLMASVKLAAGDEPAAREYFNKALAAEEGNLVSLANLARMDEQSGDLTAAEGRYLQILQSSPENTLAMTSLARIAMLRGDTDRQIKWLESARKADTKEVVSRVSLIELRIKQGNITAAEEIFNELEAASASKIAVLAARSRLLLAKKSFNQAQGVIADLIAEAPELDVAYYMQGLNNLALGDAEGATNSLRKAYSLNPSNPQNPLLLARLYTAAGQHDQALNVVQGLVDASPEFRAGHIANGDALLAAKKAKDALAAYDRAWSIEPSGDLAVRRFRAQRELSNLDAAVAILDDWLGKQPEDLLVLTQLGEFYISNGELDQAGKYYERLIQLVPDDVSTLNNLAYLYGKTDPERALEHAEKAYQLAPESPDIQDTYGWILLKNNKPVEALGMLRKAAEAMPANSEVQYHYAKALYANGDKQQAKQILKSVVDSGAEFDGIDDARRLIAQ